MEGNGVMSDLDSIEFFVEGDNKWTLYHGLNVAKHGFVTVVLDNRIFNIGDNM